VEAIAEQAMEVSGLTSPPHEYTARTQHGKRVGSGGGAGAIVVPFFFFPFVCLPTRVLLVSIPIAQVALSQNVKAQCAALEDKASYDGTERGKNCSASKCGVARQGAIQAQAK
jgi:hypothetical protein